MSDDKVILFGGTFDPVHVGHTEVARFARDYKNARQVFFIPAKRSPLKGAMPRASDGDRLAMIRLAIGDYESFDVTDWELRKPAPSYSLHTVEMFQRRFEQAHLHWLVGADGVDDLQHWYRITEFLDACNVSVMYRAGYDPPDFRQYETVWGRERVEKLRKNVIPTPLIEVSSTEVRRRLREGEPVKELLHPAVEQYIRRLNLYAEQK